MLQVVLEEVPEQLDGLVVVLVRSFPEVHLREHEVAEVVQRPEHRRGQPDVRLPVALLDQVAHEGVDPCRVRPTQDVQRPSGQLIRPKDAGPDGVVHVVVHVRDPVGEAHDLGFERGREAASTRDGAASRRGPPT